MGGADHTEPGGARHSGDQRWAQVWARWRHWWEDVADATGTATRTALALVGTVGVVLGALWWLSRQEPLPVEATLPLVEVEAVPSTTGMVEPSEVVVHVAGAVVAPGVQRLAPDARVADAVQAAGGVVADADLDRVNLAAPVSDGSRIFVPRAGEPIPEPVGDAGPTGSAGPLDLNTASAGQLETLPGIGPATAASIVEHRERHGRFPTVEALLGVRGIGEAKLAALRDLVRV